MFNIAVQLLGGAVYTLTKKYARRSEQSDIILTIYRDAKEEPDGIQLKLNNPHIKSHLNNL